MRLHSRVRNDVEQQKNMILVESDWESKAVLYMEEKDIYNILSLSAEEARLTVC